jgi:hypothetical protein
MDMLKFGYPQGDLPNSYFVAKICNQSGLFRRAAEILEAARASGGDIPADELRHYAHLPRIIRYMDENSVDENVMAERLACASQVVIKMAGTLSSFEAYGSDAGISFDYTVNAEIDRLVDIDFAISEALADRFEDRRNPSLELALMAIVFADFIRWADGEATTCELAEFPLRNASSRAYYALYHAALIRAKVLGIPIIRVPNAGSHEALIQAIRGYSPKGKSLADDMERAKKFRHRCDYIDLMSRL